VVSGQWSVVSVSSQESVVRKKPLGRLESLVQMPLDYTYC
jgi:hypothetical protein